MRENMNRFFLKRLFLAIFLFGTLIVPLAQVEGYNHPELKWRTFETEHFNIHYHEGVEWTASKAAHIAEEIYGPVTSLYGYDFDDKIHLIIRDDDDYANGITYYYDHKIVIWATNMDFEFRGTSDWLWNVITHEFTHMVSLNAARKIYRQIPAFYFQYIDYQKEKRPDVFIGYPNRLVSYPLAMTVVPMWFAEGLAQSQAPSCSYDSWDTHRDMILRMGVLEEGMLRYDEMNVFGKSGLGNEQVYDHGYGLTQYIVETYGPESLGKICRAMRPLWRIDFDGALKRVLGISGEKLYEAWKTDMRRTYETVKGERGTLVEGKVLADAGYLNIHPAWSPDGKSLVYLSNRGSDYRVLSLYLERFPDQKPKRIASGVNSPPRWSADGKKILYSKRSKPNKHGSRFNDVYVYDVEKKKQKRVTFGLRAKDPALSPDGERIVFVSNRDGTNNIGLVKADGSEVTYVTNNSEGTQYYAPCWSPDGKRILFSVSHGALRDIATIASDGSDVRYVILSPGDDRDPTWSPDGREILFSSDIDGIFNLYSYSVESKGISRMTNVLGGAFMPSYSSRGQIAYASYHSKGYQVYTLPDTVDRYEIDFDMYEPSRIAACELNPGNPVDAQAASEPYKMSFSSLFFYPRIAVDYGTLKGGMYFSNGDVLGKQSVFAGFQMNRDTDLDLFVLYEIRQFAPTIFVEFYKQTRHEDVPGTDSVFSEFEGRYYEMLDQERSFNLNEANLGARYQINDNQELELTVRYNSYGGRFGSILRYEHEVETDSGLVVVRDAYSDAFKYTYFKGWDFVLAWRNRSVKRTLDMEINPSSGHDIRFAYARALHQFLDPTLESPFEVETWGVKSIYKNYYYNRFTLDWEEYIPMPLQRHTLTLKLRAGLIDEPVYGFFNFFAGAIDGLRGYSYYSIEGRKMLLGRLTYRFPIFKSMGRQLSHLHFDKLYGAVFADAGNAWNRDKLDFWDFKRDVGAELRLETYSFYVYPTRIFFQAAYGFDNPDTSDRWRYYFGVLFGFL